MISLVNARVIGLSMIPGAMAFTVMPRPPSSRASDFVALLGKGKRVVGVDIDVVAIGGEPQRDRGTDRTASPCHESPLHAGSTANTAAARPLNSTLPSWLTLKR